MITSYNTGKLITVRIKDNLHTKTWYFDKVGSPIPVYEDFEDTTRYLYAADISNQVFPARTILKHHCSIIYK